MLIFHLAIVSLNLVHGFNTKKDYCVELKELQESMGRCTGCQVIPDILLKWH